MKESKENFSIYRNNKIFATVGRSKHINEYDIISDVINDDGSRVLTFKPTDKTEHMIRCNEVANIITEKLGEGDNKLIRKMLLDTLRDYNEDDIARMLKDLKQGASAKHKEGCFKIIVGDGRRKNSHEIMLIE